MPIMMPNHISRLSESDEARHCPGQQLDIRHEGTSLRCQCHWQPLSLPLAAALVRHWPASVTVLPHSRPFCANQSAPAAELDGCSDAVLLWTVQGTEDLPTAGWDTGRGAASRSAGAWLRHAPEEARQRRFSGRTRAESAVRRTHLMHSADSTVLAGGPQRPGVRGSGAPSAAGIEAEGRLRSGR